MDIREWTSFKQFLDLFCDCLEKTERISTGQGNGDMPKMIQLSERLADVAAATIREHIERIDQAIGVKN